MTELTDEVLAELERHLQAVIAIDGIACGICELSALELKALLAAARRCRELESAIKQVVEIKRQRDDDEYEFAAAGQTYSYGEYMEALEMMAKLVGKTTVIGGDE